MDKQTQKKLAAMATLFAALAVLPHMVTSSYITHIFTLVLLWSFVATAWAYMARFGIVSLGHGIFMALGAYVPTLLFNFYGISPWLGMWLGVAAAVVAAIAVGYPCFRFGLIGDYFALVTLALAEAGALVINAFREETGGTLGLTLTNTGRLADFQFANKIWFYYVALILLALALYIWRLVDRSRLRLALMAIGESELAAASMGVKVIKYKLTITALSAALTALGGVLYAQYVTYINPETVAGVTVSLSVCFKAILGGMFSPLGPLVGSAIIVSLEEYVRISLGSQYLGVSEIIYGVALMLLIIFMPNGIYGSLKGRLTKKMQVERG
jgi:branched-chain amino acid transport system permease protein